MDQLDIVAFLSIRSEAHTYIHTSTQQNWSPAPCFCWYHKCLRRWNYALYNLLTLHPRHSIPHRKKNRGINPCSTSQSPVTTLTAFRVVKLSRSPLVAFSGYTTYLASSSLSLLERADIDSALQTAIISSPKEKGSSTPAIPLQPLQSHSRDSAEHSNSGLEINSEKPRYGRSNRRASTSSNSQASDFSIWSDTGDLAEQLASEEDPLRIRLRKSEDDRGQEPRLRTRRVHYGDETLLKGDIDKEAIDIPNITHRRVSRAHCILAAIMSPNDMSTARTKGLVGKPLL